MAQLKSRNILLLVVLIIAAVVVGALIASASKSIAPLAFLSYSKSFGIDTARPATLDLSVLKLSFGFMLNINIAQVICLVLALLAYRKLH